MDNKWHMSSHTKDEPEFYSKNPFKWAIYNKCNCCACCRHSSRQNIALNVCIVTVTIIELLFVIGLLALIVNC